MRRIGTQPDPIDAVLDGGGDGDDVLHVAVIVHDLRATYTPTESLDVRPELAKFVGAHVGTAPAAVDSTRPVQSEPGDAFPQERRGRKLGTILSAIGGFVGTVTGKLALTTAVAAASVGGLHSADVVDVPVLPDTTRPDEPDAGVPASTTVPDERDDAASGDSDVASEGAATDAFTEAVQDWTDCVAGAASAQGNEESRTTGGFDPRQECGDQPAPDDYGLTDLPDQAADAAKEAVEGNPAPDTPVAETPAADGPANGAAGNPGSGNPGPANPGPETPAPDNPGPASRAPETPAAAGSGSSEAPSTSTDSAVGGPDTRPGGRP